jgi:hypothetical protein
MSSIQTEQAAQEINFRAIQKQYDLAEGRFIP